MDTRRKYTNERTNNQTTKTNKPKKQLSSSSSSTIESARRRGMGGNPKTMLSADRCCFRLLFNMKLVYRILVQTPNDLMKCSRRTHEASPNEPEVLQPRKTIHINSTQSEHTPCKGYAWAPAPTCSNHHLFAASRRVPGTSIAGQKIRTLSRCLRHPMVRVPMFTSSLLTTRTSSGIGLTRSPGRR